MQKTVVVLEKTICDKQELKTGISIVKLISLFVYELSKEAQINPEVKSISKEKTMWILLSDSCFQCDYIIEYYSEIIAAISEEFPIIISGIINEFEVGELRIFLKDGKLKIQKRNVTGKDFDIISDLCIKINVEDDDKLEVLNEILINIRYNKRCVAIRRKWNKYFLDDETVEEEKFTKYNYILLENCKYREDEYLNSLSIFQMTELWIDFLSNYFTALEFEFLYDKLNQGNGEKMLAWELSLRIALSKLEMSVKYSDGEFKIIDKNGIQKYYNFESFSAAEKLLLKIFFPVKTNHI